MDVLIKRYDQPVNAELEFEIYVNDQHIINIKNGQAVCLDFQNGYYEMFVVADDYTTNKIEFEIHEGKKINFVCGSKMPDQSGIRTPFAVRKMSHFVFIDLDQDLEG